MALNIKRVRLRVPIMAREEYKQIVVDISAIVENMVVKKVRINCGKTGHFARDCT